MLEKCLLILVSMAAGAYLENRRSVKNSATLLKAFGSAFTTKKEETKTESETEKTDN